MYVLPAMQKDASCQQAASARPYITFSSASQCACLVRPSVVAIADLQLVIRQQAAGFDSKCKCKWAECWQASCIRPFLQFFWCGTSVWALQSTGQQLLEPFAICPALPCPRPAPPRPAQPGLPSPAVGLACHALPYPVVLYPT